MDVEDRESPFDVASESCGQLGVHLSTDEDSEGDGPGQETSSDDEPALPPDLAWLEDLYEEDDDDGDGDGNPSVVADNGEKRSYAATARMFKLRRNLDQLDCFHRQKEHDVLKAREELKLCHQNIESLVEQRDDVENEIERQKAAENSVAVFRLRSQHKHLCQRLQSEEELEGHINTDLKQQELELNEVAVELGRFSSLRQEVQEEERVFQLMKAQKAATRIQQERKASQNLQLKMQHLRDKQAAMLMKAVNERQKNIEAGQANRRMAAKHLKETIKRMHQQEAEKEQQNRELLEKRIQAVKSLKSNIAATQESLRVQQRKAKANTQKKEQQQRQLRESLQAQGINSIKHMYQQKQLEEIKRKQEEFAERQKSKRVEIAAKILEEEQLVNRRKRHQAVLPKPSTTDSFPSLGRVREKLLHYLDPSPPSATEERATIQLREVSDSSSSSSASSDAEDLEETMHQEGGHQSLTESLAEPEFSGLWDQNSKKLQDEKAMSVQTEVKQEQPAMASGKLNVIVKKVHGKELKGPPFLSKPEIIIFKDFEVGKMYKKKIVLTNISYVTNHCKLLGVSTHLKDFISINFEPPGSLSAGMSCEMQAVFQPMINEDLEGEVQFASAVAPFSVPVRCTTKKCDLEVDSQFVDFGLHVVGQTISRTVTLTNKGALATLFSLDTSSCLSPESSHVQVPTQVSANTCQEISSENTTSENQRSSASIGTGELQPQQESQELSEALQQEQSVSEASATGPEAVLEACVSTDVDAHMDHSDGGDISLGNVREGQIGPFESIKLEVVFTPTIPGEAKLDFHIKFSDITSKPIPIQVRAVAVSVPVWVVQPSIDLKICMFDRLYQDSIMVQSRAKTALKLTFEVCPEMRKHMEILPKTGFIQAQSSFNAQLKFLPRCSLSKDAKKFFDSDTGVLEVPMTVQVAGQVKPVHFTVQAVVTSSDLQFDRTEADFGCCSIYQKVISSIRLTNLSLLPQDFGFLRLPEFIEVQPNDGFGTLLPQETLEIDLIFCAHKAKEYSFQISCKSGINRDFHLSCRAVVVSPPLELSHSLVQFGATAVGDHSTTIISLINRETNQNQSKQPIDPEDAMTLVAPRLFSFLPPKDSDISIAPSAGALLPGERCLVQVTFRPRLLDQEIKEEALRLFHRAKLLREKELERNTYTEKETKKEVPVKTNRGKKAPAIPNNSKVLDGPKTEQLTEPSNAANIQPGSEQYEDARASLLYSFTQRYREYTVPCFVSDRIPPEDGQEQPAWSPFNTLDLQLQCPAVQPALVVISNNGHNIIDFHQVAVGEKVIKRLTVQNISKESLDLRSSVLDVHGAFSLLNALRCIKPGDKHTLVLAFSPCLEEKYCETLEVRSQKMTLRMTLCGEGVVPAVTCSHPGGVLDFGYVLERESTAQVFKLQNSSVVAVGFRVQLASLSPTRPQGGADRVAFLLGSNTDSQVQPTVGTQNYSGLSVFSVVPVEGSIAPGQSQDITVTFQPDHPSVNYSDRLTIELMNKSKVCMMDLKGAASSHNMYLYGGDLLTVPVESLLPPLIASQPQLAESEVTEKPTIPVLVTLRAKYNAGTITPAVRELQVGCIRSTQPSKKSGEFLWDNVASLQQQGFSVEPGKGTMEAGHKRTITIKWTPYSGYKPYEVVQTCVPVTLKGDETNVYRVTLIALVSTTAD
ncbi:cilia- and flagella-associated protein 74 isoform X2 [Pagrus major]|uniref:cilia- and flagella-associated protein 74 isoform X2 n=1 Tax=Pagrus major TaxID=143350 RepID=UPI003CC8505D